MTCWFRVIPDNPQRGDGFNEEEIAEIQATRQAIRDMQRNLTDHMTVLLNYLNQVKEQNLIATNFNLITHSDEF